MDKLSQQCPQEPEMVWPPLNVTMLENGFWMLPELPELPVLPVLPVINLHDLFPELPADVFSQATTPAEPVMANGFGPQPMPTQTFAGRVTKRSTSTRPISADKPHNKLHARVIDHHHNVPQRCRAKTINRDPKKNTTPVEPRQPVLQYPPPNVTMVNRGPGLPLYPRIEPPQQHVAQYPPPNVTMINMGPGKMRFVTNQAPGLSAAAQADLDRRSKQHSVLMAAVNGPLLPAMSLEPAEVGQFSSAGFVAVPEMYPDRTSWM
jgi:hypothetical protein